ncbi:MAG: hypothetical protein WEA77_02770 [Hyphomonas sp.]|uniref:hypothetical protein n=1 Tax=Hyphomonas sp. TaxID=87 RepID=UPI0034A02FFB
MPKVALTAIMRKLVILAKVVIRDDCEWSPGMAWSRQILQASVFCIRLMPYRCMFSTKAMASAPERPAGSNSPDEVGSLAVSLTGVTDIAA